MYSCGFLLKINVKLHYCTFFESIILAGFYPKNCLPTLYSEHWYCHSNRQHTNHIDNSTSGVFINDISDDQMSFTYSNDSFLNNNTAKCIDIESNTIKKLDHFLIELQNIDLTPK